MVTIGFKLRDYLKTQFPDRILQSYVSGRVPQEERYILISTVLDRDMEIHYELYQNRVELHLEGKYHKEESISFVDELRKQTVNNPHLSWREWQGYENARCQIDKPTDSWDEIVQAFNAIIDIFDPIIEKIKRNQTMEQNNPLEYKSNSNGCEKHSIDARIVSVKSVLEIKNLRIPEYQRPYRWTEKNVRQLLEDVLASKNAGKKNYRIGSVILHENDNEKTLDIVDGQQRVTTLLLIAKACGEQLDGFERLKYNHCDSFENIKKNYLFIELWLADKCKETKKEFFNYISNSCEFVKITVTDLSEAFQMFDSQNGRGKELEAYNLLKAYHIRAMEQESSEDKIQCDRRWEAATQYDATPKILDDPNVDILMQLFDEQLYRSRVWSRGDCAGEFSKKKIDEFKGFTIDKNHPALFPYQNPQLLQYLTSKFYKNVLSGTVATQSRFVGGDSENVDPFVNINQQIVNGKPFFDFIETYVEIYKRMFIDIGTYQLSEFKEFYYSFCLNYGDDKDNRVDKTAFIARSSATRSGDTYLREAYKSLVFVLFDKFGEGGLNKYYKVLYRLIYCHRLEKSAIKYKFVKGMPNEYFKIITEAKDLSDLSELERKIPDKDTMSNYSNKDKVTKSVSDFICGIEKDNK